MTRDPRTELVILRISLARVAQAHGVDNNLGVLGKTYEELYALASTEERGWNDLARLCAEQANVTSDFIKLSTKS